MSDDSEEFEFGLGVKPEPKEVEVKKEIEEKPKEVKKEPKKEKTPEQLKAEQEKKKKLQEKKKAEAKKEEETKQKIITDLDTIKKENESLRETINKFEEDISELKTLTEELDLEAEKGLKASNYIAKYNELKNNILNLSITNENLLNFFNSKIEAYQTKSSFQLDANDIKQYIWTNFKNITAWNSKTSSKKKEELIKQYLEKYDYQIPIEHQATINRTFTPRGSYLRTFIWIINKYFEDKSLSHRLDSKTLEVLKDYLLLFFDL